MVCNICQFIYTWDPKFHIKMNQELMAIKLTYVPKEKSVAFKNVCDSRMSCHEEPNSQSYCLPIPTVVPFTVMNFINQHGWPETAINVYNCSAYPFYFRGSIGVQLF
jgi:hypothetical protein